MTRRWSVALDWITEECRLSTITTSEPILLSTRS